jgi:hypothetical protein
MTSQVPDLTSLQYSAECGTCRIAPRGMVHAQDNAAIIQYCNPTGSRIPVQLVPASMVSRHLSFGQQ